MRCLLVDHFTTTPVSPRARFGIPEPELRQRVEASVHRATAALEAQHVQHEVLVHNGMRSLRILPGATQGSTPAPWAAGYRPLASGRFEEWFRFAAAERFDFALLRAELDLDSDD